MKYSIDLLFKARLEIFSGWQWYQEEQPGICFCKDQIDTGKPVALSFKEKTTLRSKSCQISISDSLQDKRK